MLSLMLIPFKGYGIEVNINNFGLRKQNTIFEAIIRVFDLVFIWKRFLKTFFNPKILLPNN
ncbi:hypothetical protein CYANOKiyG1_31850 [Okeania sp. KiyG1]|nr:hypothetical protein CYANOKiyG1_31850 [Okeania sp. KiyG1]